MNIEELIALSVDGQLSDEEQARVKAALAESAELRTLHADLRAMRELELPEPTAPALSASFMERVKSETQTRKGFQVITGRWPKLPGPLLAMAAAVCLLFAASYFSEKEGIEREVPPEVMWQSQAIAYHLNVAPLEKLALERIQNVEQGQVQGFVQQLAFINRMVQRCEESMALTPDNPELHQALADAYVAKVELLEAIVSAV